MEVKFFLPVAPPTATHQTQAVRVVKGKPVFYDPPALADARQKLTALLWLHRPPKPMTGPVELCVMWCFPLDKGKRHRDGEFKTSRPDTDNLQKLLKDCMTKAGFWKDDAQVCEEFVQKLWAALPGILIQVREMDLREMETS